MLRTLLAAILVPALAATASGQPHIGDPAPEVSIGAYLDAPGDAPTSLAELRGKVVVLEFWATWCAPCVAAIPHLNEVAEAVKDEPVVFISITNEQAEAVEPFLKKRPMRSWVAQDTESATFKAYGVRYIPHTVVIGRDGKVAAITSPEAITAAALREAVAGRALGLAEKVDRPADLEWDKSSGLAPDEEAAIAHAVLQRSQSTGGTMRFLPGSGRIQGDGLAWQVLLQIAHDVEPSQVVGKVPELEGQVFRISVKSAAGDDAGARAMLREVVERGLGLRGEIKLEERPVTVLARQAGAAAPEPSTKEKGGSMARSGHIALSRVTMQEAAEMIAGFATGRMGVDETGLAGEYDLELRWTPSDRESLAAALAAYGLELRSEKREVPVLHAQRRAPGGG